MDDFRRYRQQGKQDQGTARNELFSGATQQNYPPPPQNYNYTPQQGGGYGGGYGQPQQGGGYYAPYGQQQQQETEEDIEGIKSQIRTTKQDSVASTQRSLQMINQAEQNAQNTLTKLGEQTQRINYTERQLDLAEAHAERAEAQAAKLKKVNGSMFGFDISNPFTKGKRERKELERVQAMQEEQRLSREQQRSGNWESQQRINDALKHQPSSKSSGYQQGHSSDRSRFQFEADEEDEQLENQIDNNLDALSSGLDRLNAMAVASGEEVRRQNDVLNRIGSKTEGLDQKIVTTTHKLKKI
ncbi:2328_t:CDS:2, partial [Ambispora leptoticha]